MPPRLTVLRARNGKIQEETYGGMTQETTSRAEAESGVTFKETDAANFAPSLLLKRIPKKTMSFVGGMRIPRLEFTYPELRSRKMEVPAMASAMLSVPPLCTLGECWKKAGSLGGGRREKEKDRGRR